MDAETQLAIEEGNRKVSESITRAFKDALKQAVENIISHIDLKVTPLEKDVERLRVGVSDLYEKDRDMRDRVGRLEQRQASDEGMEAGKSKAHAVRDKKFEMTAGKIALMLTGFSMIGGLIGWVLTATL